MKPPSASISRQYGAIGCALLVVVLAVAATGAWLWLDEDAGIDLKREARISALDVIGDAATERLSSATGDATHGSAVDLINRPIEVRKVSDTVFYATGVGNTVMIITDEGNVVFDTGLVLQSAKQLRALQEVSSAPVRYVVLSHSHADHVGGARLWVEQGTQLIAHEEFEEEQRYLSELDAYFYGRNRTLFPWMPAERPDIGLLKYGGLKPTRTVGDHEVLRFSLGGVSFEVIGAPGAEGADNIVLWLPQQKMLISGDFFGPQFPQFPNIFTMRGEKVRKPIEYIDSLNRLLALQPEVIVPSHLDPTVGGSEIREGMLRIRDAVQYVHDETIAGMNAGKTVYELMREIELPSELTLVQNHGRVDWAVKSIWEYYATWFHFDSTTELYPTPVRSVYADVAAAAGGAAMLDLASGYLQQDEPVKALHVIEMALAGKPANRDTLLLRQAALTLLMDKAQSGLKNDYEIYWLKARLADTAAQLRINTQG
tara:strand:- start:53689 stop:55143 length:1455 start_codon:yes stop_codon:yes gene_type:complete